MRVVSTIAEAVTNLEQPDEQSADNLDLIADVFSQIDTLIDRDMFNATPEVCISLLTIVFFSLQLLFLLVY